MPSRHGEGEGNDREFLTFRAYNIYSILKFFRPKCRNFYDGVGSVAGYFRTVEIVLWLRIYQSGLTIIRGLVRRGA